MHDASSKPEVNSPLSSFSLSSRLAICEFESFVELLNEAVLEPEI